MGEVKSEYLMNVRKSPAVTGLLKRINSDMETPLLIPKTEGGDYVLTPTNMQAIQTYCDKNNINIELPR